MPLFAMTSCDISDACNWQPPGCYLVITPLEINVHVEYDYSSFSKVILSVILANTWRNIYIAFNRKRNLIIVFMT